jgi:4-hydroxythreonine-4-phosphate dehydrogenase
MKCCDEIKVYSSSFMTNLSALNQSQPESQPLGPAMAITPGDPCGIGPEIVAKAWRDAPQVMQGCRVWAEASVMARAAQLVGLQQPVPLWPVAGLPAASALAYGQVSAAAGAYSSACVREATRAALRGEAAAVVTAPIHKEAWGAAGVPFPGHTELLQHEAAAFAGMDAAQMPVRMMLANDELRTVLVSIHLSLREALARVTKDGVLQTICITHEALQPVLGRAPRIAVAGLNPHAGEGGLFGSEEKIAISPAIAAANALKIEASGPYPPDTIFMQARGFKRFDVVIAMYHDQGLIPVKYLGVEKGVNVTLGLHNGAGKPLIRTSPDHGTAFDIAGKGVADASSLIEAVRQARALVR